MLEFFTQNLGTIIVGIIVLAIILAIILKLRNDKKHGKLSCGCDCENCPNSKNCHGSIK